MKENILRIGRLYLFLILGACISFVCCDSDDEDEIPIVEKTFLENYDGTKWVTIDANDGYITYLRINNNLRVPFEVWGLEVDPQKAGKGEFCYLHDDSFMDEDVEIIENSGNRFTIGYEGMEFWAIEIRGEILKLGDRDVWDDPNSIVFEKTTVNVDDFEICTEDD